MEIKLFGKPSYSYEYLKSTIEDIKIMADLNIELTEVQDISEFIKEEINHIPAIKINGDTRVFKNRSIQTFSKKVTSWILDKMGHGSLRKLIVPIDYSTTSENALAYAKSLSKDQGQFIELTHCYSPKVVGLTDKAEVDFKNEKYEEQRFQEYHEGVNLSWIGESNKDIPMDAQFLIGFPSDRLIEVSKDDNNNLIVMGSNGNAGIQKRVFGSVSTTLVQKSHCPVLIVPPDAKYTGFKNILYCCDDPSIDSKVIPDILDFTRGQNPNVHLVHVGDDDYNEKLTIDVWNKLYHIDHIRYNKLVHMVEKNILKGYCDQFGIDLIIVSRAKRGFLSNLFHKSFSKEMAIYTDTPLLIINEK